MKKTIATAMATLLLCGMSAAIVSPANAASYTVHISSKKPVAMHHHRHWHQHLWCKTTWRHHHKVKVCVWVPDRH